MLALYRCDRQADALQAYQDARSDPGRGARNRARGAATRARARDTRPGSRPPAGGSRRAAGGRSPPADPRRAFVGRAGELAQLVAALDDAFAGRGRLILLAGEPGIGKSRLADALAEHARARGAGVLVGRCWEAGGAPAYWPWIQALRIQIADTEPEALRAQLGAGAAELAQLIPELRERLPDAAGAGARGGGRALSPLPGGELVSPQRRAGPPARRRPRRSSRG